MILPMLLLLAQAAPALPPSSPAMLAELPPQTLARGRCALFLWDRASGKRVAMMTADPAQLRLAAPGGKVQDLPREQAQGDAVLGFAPVSQYRDSMRGFEIRLTILPATAGGALVKDGSISITDANGSTVVVPVAGLAGCPQ